MRALLLTLALAAAPLVLGGCASGPPGRTILDGGGWTYAGTESHDALADGTQIVWWTRGMGPERERAGALRTAEGDVRPADLGELRTHCRPLGGPRTATRYAELALRLSIDGVPLPGQPVVYAPGAPGRGAAGEFTDVDADAWGIDPGAPATRSAGGYRFEQVVLVAPVQDPDLKSFITPWRVVLVDTVVYPDGAITGRESRTLTNGEDAERFVRF